MEMTTQPSADRPYTYEMKLCTIKEHLYCTEGRPEWAPKAGMLYTILRDDLDLFHIDEVTETTVTVSIWQDVYDNPPQLWERDGFTTEGFGINRIPLMDYMTKLLNPEKDSKGIIKIEEG